MVFSIIKAMLGKGPTKAPTIPNEVVASDKPQGIEELLNLLAAATDNNNANSAADKLAKIVINKGKAGFDVIVPRLIDIIKTSKNQSARSYTANALMAIATVSEIKDDKFLEALRAGLNDKNKDVRNCFAMALGDIEDIKSTAAITKLLEDNESRYSAAYALYKIGVVESLPALLEALKDEREDVHSQIVTTLAEIGMRESEAVISILANTLENKDEQISLGVTQALHAMSQEGIIAAKAVLDNALREQRKS